MKNIIFFFMLAGLALSLKAQKEGYNWYFGSKAGLTFHTTPPSPLGNGSLVTSEGCATISTSAGKLLFYTDGITVWDSTHKVMSNGSGLKGNSSSTQSGIIVPRPDSIHLYYIFTVGAQGWDGLYYSMVDMRLNGGKGDIVANAKNILLKSVVSEKITAVVQANGRDFWVLSLGYGTDSIFAYQVTDKGVMHKPVGGSTGFNITGASSNTIGYLKVSPSGKKMAFTTYTLDTGMIADFDIASGKVSNCWTFHSNDGYGVEFSPKGNFLYISELWSTRIFQYDVSATTRKSFISSRTRVDTIGYRQYGALQLGPDGKIYCAPAGDSFLSVIHAPDSIKTSCRFQNKYIKLTSYNTLGLPTFIQSYFRENKISANGICLGDSTFFNLTSEKKADSMKWHFGDPSSGPSNTSVSTSHIYHIYKKTGKYKVTLFSYDGNRADTTHMFVQIYPKVHPYIGRDTNICKPFRMKLKAERKYMSYKWYGAKASQDSVLPISGKGMYILTVTDSGDCKGTDTIHIANPYPTAAYDLSDTVLCLVKHVFRAKDTSTYVDDTPNKITWHFGDGTYATDTGKMSKVSKTYTAPGTYRIRLIVQTNSGCRDSIDKTVRVVINSSALFANNKDTQCLQGNQFMFSSKGPANHFHWTFGDGHADSLKNPKHTYQQTGTYKVLLTTFFDSSICISKDSLWVTVKGVSANISINRDTQCFNGHRFEFSVKGDTSSLVSWALGDGQTATGLKLNHTYKKPGKYKVILSGPDSNACIMRDTVSVLLFDPVADIKVNTDSQCLKNNLFVFEGAPTNKHYRWDFGNGSKDSARQGKQHYQTQGHYRIILQVQDSFLCGKADTINLLVIKDPKAMFSYDMNLCRRDVLFIGQSQHAMKYSWLIDTTVIYTKDAKYAFNGAGQYHIKLIVLDSSGHCADTMEQLIDIEPSKKQQPLMIPNVFTPGTDGLNDCFLLGGLDASCGDKGDLLIYNRWGVQVFDGKLPMECWNGRINNHGDTCPAGVYYYVLKLDYTDQEGNEQSIKTNGVIHLIR